MPERGILAQYSNRILAALGDMEDLKISDEEPPRPVYGGGPLVRALAARQIGRHSGPRPAVRGVNRAIEELAENKLIDRGEDFQALQCQLGGATRYRYRSLLVRR